MADQYTTPFGPTSVSVNPAPFYQQEDTPKASVTSRHADYELYAPQWQIVRDALSWEGAVKAHGPTYLPQLGGQDSDEYGAYKMRALWYGATRRTHQGIAGAVFRKEPVVNYGTPQTEAVLVPLLPDMTLTDLDLYEFAKTVFAETFALGWGGILVDRPISDDIEPLTSYTDRPLCSFYKAENVTNWRTKRIGGKMVLVQVRLYEIVEQPGVDEFTVDAVEQYRILKLVFNKRTEKWEYHQDLWQIRENEKKEKVWQKIQTLIPHKRGEPLDFIPFYPCTPRGVEPCLESPLLLDMATLNFDHYRLSADHRHGLHFTALPTAWVAGFSTEAELRIGSQTAWVSDNANARAGFMEFTGAGLGAIVTALEKDERMMAVLGARLLEEQKRAVETAKSQELRRVGEDSIVQSTARAVGQILEKALWTCAWWQGVEKPQVSVQLNTDILSTVMEPTMLAELTRARQAGEISQQTYLEALIRGEVVQGRTWEEEQVLIKLDGPRETGEVGEEDQVEDVDKAA